MQHVLSRPMRASRLRQNKAIKASARKRQQGRQSGARVEPQLYSRPMADVLRKLAESPRGRLWKQENDPVPGMQSLRQSRPDIERLSPAKDDSVISEGQRG